MTRQTFEINDIGSGVALDITIFVPYTFTAGINTDPYEVGGIRCVLSKSPNSTDGADISV